MNQQAAELFTTARIFNLLGVDLKKVNNNLLASEKEIEDEKNHHHFSMTMAAPVVSFHSDEWGDFRTYFKFQLSPGRKIERLDIGQAT